MKKFHAAFFAFAVAANSVSAVERNFFVPYDEFSELPTRYGAEYYDVVIDNKPVYELTFEEWFNAPHASTGLFGLRKPLEENGIIPVITYLGNFAANPVGGDARGAAISSNVNLGYGADLAKLLRTDALDGFSLENTWVWRFGRSISTDRIHNAFNVQQNWGGETMHLQSLALVYKFGSSDGAWRAFVKAGRIAAGDNFMTKPIYWLYQNNAFDGNPVGAYKQTKLSAYPGSTWGAMGQVNFANGVYFKAGVYQINTDKQDSSQGFDWSFSGRGVNADFEVGWDINHDSSGRSPGNISAGFISDWYNAPYNRGGYSNYNCSAYVQADYMIVNLGQVKNDELYYIHRAENSWRDLRGIVLWGAFQFNPQEGLAEMPYFFNGGFLFNAPFASRADDVFCVGFAYGKYSSSYGNSYQRGSYEMVVEANYKIQINRFMFVQPNVQWVINTNGGEYPDALVLGMQFGFAL